MKEKENIKQTISLCRYIRFLIAHYIFVFYERL